MRTSVWRVAAAAVAIGAALALATAIGNAGAASPRVTLGSTAGTPSQNLCGLGIQCTYFSFTSGFTPAVQVPSDGTVTSFSLNSGSAFGLVSLRVLRPTGAGFTGAGTSAPEALNAGVNTFNVSLPVKAGDVLGVDNDSSALLFDTTSATASTPYYQEPSLADGATDVPNYTQSGYRLLLSVTEQLGSGGGGTTTTTSTSSNSSGGAISTNPAALPTPSSARRPRLTRVSQSDRVWREGKKLVRVAAAKGPVVGTRLRFRLNEEAKVTLTFKRRKSRKTVGQLAFIGDAGINKVFFQGRLTRRRRLPPGNYELLVTASTTAGSSRPVVRTFTILP